MLSCKEVSRLVSESLDRELPFRQRVPLRLHLLMCSLCSHFRRQLLFLRGAARSFGKAGAADKLPAHIRLSPTARARIKHALEHDGR
jgi:hypothetical protein